VTRQDPPDPAAAHGDAPARASLAVVAAALDEELQRFEELSATARRLPLKSQKNLERAAQTTREAAASQERFGAHLRALVDAVAAARDRQQVGADTLAEAAQAIEQRWARFEALMARFGAIGTEAGVINTLVQEVGALRRDGPNATPPAAIVARLREIQAQMTTVIESAQGLARDATDDDLVDVARQSDALRQQILAARNKLHLLEQRLAEEVNGG
jgi:hypothetical protein